MDEPKEHATKLEYLEYFYQVADFGPAHGDVVYYINEGFTKHTGKLIPVGYEYE